ncbi:bifunctional DNA-formamidopyrimidine glycosylase/DNA-(apurinic or apyrimidinic site) lyase [Candidatus Saccharibacteria bacterium]|nr:bifunctional DNA-formamidopyrimidine glycosylase/DNA-(apurinic or apyrimidinic site) lyase [Candidatus Saccharibacteria bacterium]
MPELPEVETIRRGLAEVLIGQTFIGLSFGDNSQGETPSLPFDNGKTPQSPQNNPIKVCRLRRFGKLLVIDFDNGWSLTFHLRMTGQLVYRAESLGVSGSEGVEKRTVAGGHPTASWVGELPDKSTRAVFEFERGKLFFNDQRKFGFYEWVETDKVEEIPFVKKLGPEPWVMSVGELAEKLQRHKKMKIKAALLDQTIMAGLGNIYADETLYYARVSPLRLAGSLTRAEVGRVIEGAKKSMEASLESGGSSMKNYRRSDGSYGDYLDLFAKVYGRAGAKCERDGCEIVKIKVAGRGTHYCPCCQK